MNTQEGIPAHHQNYLTSLKPGSTLTAKNFISLPISSYMLLITSTMQYPLKEKGFLINPKWYEAQVPLSFFKAFLLDGLSGTKLYRNRATR